jgi:hypothetical protein
MSERFLRISSKLLLVALAPLAVGLSLDVFLLGKLVVGQDAIAALLALVVFATMVAMWYVFPHAANRQSAG